MPLTTMAQDDDLYFNPKHKDQEAALREQRAKAYARVQCRSVIVFMLFSGTGSPRSVDEYNRNGTILSQYQGITTDSLGNDIISFRLRKVSNQTILRR